MGQAGDRDSLINLDGYELLRSDGVCVVCVFCRQINGGHRVQVSSLNDKYKLPPSVDSIWRNVTLSNFPIRIGCIYAPPNITLQDQEIMNVTITEAFASETVTFVFGDFNLPEIDWQTLTLKQPSLKAQSFLDTYKVWNGEQLVNFPTRYRGDQNSLLDLILVSDKKLVANIQSLPPMGLSDHVVITATAQLKIPSKATNKIKKRNFWKADYEKINNYIRNQSRIQDPMTDKYQVCLNIINQSVSIYIPEKCERKNFQKTWINRQIIKAIRKKRRLWDSYKRKRTQHRYVEYQRQNNQLKTLMRNTRKSYEERLLEQSDKQFFKYVKRSLNSNISSIVLKNTENHEVVSDPRSVANMFAEQFSRVYTREDLAHLPFLPPDTRTLRELERVVFTSEKITEALDDMKSDSSPGPDCIPTVFLQKSQVSLAPVLAEAMNQIMESGNFPPTWKEAHVVPIFKKGCKYDALNYRPISLTCNPCKLMEKVIVKEITSFLHENETLPSSQHGFLSKRSTITNLINCLDKWTKAYDENQPIDVIYLDYEKAFDKVPHTRLLIKLEHLGIRGRLLIWIENFLRSRTCNVRVENHLSRSYEVLSGVPQGSVMGPLLFLIYISDLAQCVRSDVVFFADDTKIFGNALTNSRTLADDLKTLQVWTHTWQLKLNENKCTTLHIGPNNPRNTYYLNSIPLKHVDNQLDLRVTITSNLKWESHIAKIVKKANSVLFLISRAFHSKSVMMITKLYKTYVRPILEYANSVWNPYFVKDIEVLERVQRRATKIPTQIKHLPYLERLQVCGLPSLKDRRLRGDLIETFKTLNGYYAVNLNTYQLSGNENLRGHSLKLSKERCAKLPRKNFICNRVVYAWNALSEGTVSASSVNSFKNRVDKDLQQINTDLVHYF